MINTIGLLLESSTEYQLNTSICDMQTIQNAWKYLRKNSTYFPNINLLPDGNLKIEFCPSKILYGNNLYEITSKNIWIF